jgi:anti-sigma-K factor RskA
MIELTCTEVRDASAEFALGILPAEERASLAAHLLRCPSCREEVEGMMAVGARLLDLVPGTEPPLGFDRRALARVHGSRAAARAGSWRRPSRVITAIAAAAAAAALFASVGWMAHGDKDPAEPAHLTAEFHQNGRAIGEVDAYGSHPLWVSMSVHGAAASGMVTCELIGRDGTIRLGSFPLVRGGGAWSAPDPRGLEGVTGARLVDGQGRVVATADFT